MIDFERAESVAESVLRARVLLVWRRDTAARICVNSHFLLENPHWLPDASRKARKPWGSKKEENKEDYDQKCWPIQVS